MRYLLLLALALVSCGPRDVVPPTGSECSRDANIAETCWTCSSEPACAWWGTTNDDLRGCHARVDLMQHEDVTVVRISDDCNSLPLDAAR